VVTAITQKEFTMKKILVLASILLLSAVGVRAQQNTSGGSFYPGVNLNNFSGGPAGDERAWLGADQTTLVGTLAEMDGSYNLIDGTGAAYRLIGDTAGLRDLVGSTIQVTGYVPMNASNLEGEQMNIRVIDFERVTG
jgi:hypothetical protein